jgi:membrane protein
MPPMPHVNDSPIRRKVTAGVEIVDRTYRSWRDDRTIRLGAGLAYYALFGLVPFFTLAISIAGFAFSRQEIQEFVAESLVRLLGAADAAALGEYLANNVSSMSSTGSLGLIGVGTLVFASSLVLASLQDALNLIFGIPVEPGLRVSVQRRMWLFVLVLGFAAVVLASLILNTVVTALGRLFRLDELAMLGPVEAILGRASSWVLMVALLAVVYQRVPRAHVAWRPAIIGAVVCVVAASLAVAVVQLYLTRFATTSVEGAAGALALILTLVYVLSQVLLAGAQVVKVLNEAGFDA